MLSKMGAQPLNRTERLEGLNESTEDSSWLAHATTMLQPYGNTAFNEDHDALKGIGDASQGGSQTCAPLVNPYEGFDYHGAELIDPAVTELPSFLVKPAILVNAMKSELNGADVSGSTPTKLENALTILDHYDALLEEELQALATVNGLDPGELPDEVVALAQELAVHRLNVGHTGGAGAVDLELLDPIMKYNYLHDQVLRMGGEFSEDDKEVNLVGVRGLQDGKPGDNAPNEYNDSIYVLRMVDGQPEITAFPATTDYGDPAKILELGDFGLDVDGERYQMLLPPGSYSYTPNPNRTSDDWHLLKDPWGSPVPSIADLDGDRQVDPEELANPEAAYPGRAGMNIHSGGSADQPVNSWSAGCQVIPTAPAQPKEGVNYYDRFESLVTEDPRFARKEDITYTLLDSKTLPSTVK